MSNTEISDDLLGDVIESSPKDVKAGNVSTGSSYVPTPETNLEMLNVLVTPDNDCIDLNKDDVMPIINKNFTLANIKPDKEDYFNFIYNQVVYLNDKSFKSERKKELINEEVMIVTYKKAVVSILKARNFYIKFLIGQLSLTRSHGGQSGRMRDSVLARSGFNNSNTDVKVRKNLRRMGWQDGK